IALVKAFAFDKELQKMANLAIFIGEFGHLGGAQKILLKEIQKLTSQASIRKKVCLPDEDLDFENEVPVLYRLVAERKGVFVNPALIEPFGLTILEAAASGLPVVATKNGGPSEIITPGEHGFLIEPRNSQDIADKIKKIIKDPKLWQKISEKGRQNVLERYTWKAAARKELQVMKGLLPKE
ncbi:glycosyltransferase, partial [Candidatus Altiarchaeota archaeon]